MGKEREPDLNATLGAVKAPPSWIGRNENTRFPASRPPSQASENKERFEPVKK